MFTVSSILRHVTALPYGKMFTTRELLIHGTRTAVDQAIGKLIKLGYIHRLARGVFIRITFTQDMEKINVLPHEIAYVKAAAFGKLILKSADDILRNFGIENKTSIKLTFVTNGPSSKFRFGSMIIYFKAVGMRKFTLGETGAAGPLRAIWEIGQKAYNHNHLVDITRKLQRSDWQEKSKSVIASLLPSWLTEQLPLVMRLEKRKNKAERVAQRQEEEEAQRLWDIFQWKLKAHSS